MLTLSSIIFFLFGLAFIVGVTADSLEDNPEMSARNRALGFILGLVLISIACLLWPFNF
jgi:hypothetical protein